MSDSGFGLQYRRNPTKSSKTKLLGLLLLLFLLQRRVIGSRGVNNRTVVEHTYDGMLTESCPGSNIHDAK